MSVLWVTLYVLRYVLLVTEPLVGIVGPFPLLGGLVAICCASGMCS